MSDYSLLNGAIDVWLVDDYIYTYIFVEKGDQCAKCENESPERVFRYGTSNPDMSIHNILLDHDNIDMVGRLVMLMWYPRQPPKYFLNSQIRNIPTNNPVFDSILFFRKLSGGAWMCHIRMMND